MSAAAALRGRRYFNRNDSENLFQGRYAHLKFLQSVFVHRAHSIGPRSAPDEVGFERSAQNFADRFVDNEQFVDSHASLEARLFAEVAAYGHELYIDRFSAAAP